MKNQKGITLVALIITIIVMLILVAVSVTVALQTGLFTSAQTAAQGMNANAVAENQISEGKVTITGINTPVDISSTNMLTFNFAQ